MMSPEDPSSDAGSDYDDVDYGDEHESEGGGDGNSSDAGFAGVTSDLEVGRESGPRERKGCWGDLTLTGVSVIAFVIEILYCTKCVYTNSCSLYARRGRRILYHMYDRGERACACACAFSREPEVLLPGEDIH